MHPYSFEDLSEEESDDWLNLTDEYEESLSNSPVPKSVEKFLAERDVDPSSRLGKVLQNDLKQIQSRHALPPLGYGPWIPFENGDLVASGAMGEVRIANHDRSFRRLVAVKSLKLELMETDDRSYFDRFIEEGELLASLEHSGIPPVFERTTLSNPEGIPCYSMKLIRGQTFHELLHRQDSSNLVSNLNLFIRIADAVGYAHQKNIVHRDLKPSNIMVDENNEVQVIDWGLGVSTDQLREEQSREDAGTIAYMSPEHFAGAGEISAASDVFSLGSILCELLTGRPAYLGRSSADVKEKAASASLGPAFDRLDQYVGSSQIHSELADICKKSLNREPALRFKNGNELADSIRAYQQSLSDRLRKTELEIVRRNLIRRSVIAIGVLSSFFLGLVGFVSIQHLIRQATAQAGEANLEKQLSEILTNVEANADGILKEQRDKKSWETFRAFPDQWHRRILSLKSEIQSIEIARDTSGFDINSQLSERINKVNEATDALLTDYQLFERVDAIRMQDYLIPFGSSDSERAKNNTVVRRLSKSYQSYTKLFLDHPSYDPQSQDPEQIVSVVTDCRLPWLWVSAYDDFALANFKEHQSQQVKTLRHIASSIDVDEFANRIRDFAISSRKPRQLKRWIKDERTLDLPEELLSVISGEQAMLRPPIQNENVFLQAARYRKNSFELWMAAGSVATDLEKEKLAFTNALSLRPDNWIANSRIGVVATDEMENAIREDQLDLAADKIRFANAFHTNAISSAPEPIAQLLHNLGYQKELEAKLLQLRQTGLLGQFFPMDIFEPSDSLQFLKLQAESIQLYKKAVEVDREFSQSWNNLGAYYRDQKNLDKAEECFRNAVGGRSPSAATWLNYGLLERHRNDDEAAENCFKSSLEIDPELDSAWGNLALIHLERGEKKLAREMLEKAVKFSLPNSTNLKFWKDKLSKAD